MFQIPADPFLLSQTETIDDVLAPRADRAPNLADMAQAAVRRLNDTQEN